MLLRYTGCRDQHRERRDRSRVDRLGQHARFDGCLDSDHRGSRVRCLPKEPRDQDRNAQSSGGLMVEKDSVLVDALSYLATVAVFALLVLPARWRGLQLIDGVIAVLVYVAFLTQALLRGRGG